MTPRSSSVDVGQRLAAARLQRGLAQADVARNAGLAPSYLSRIENGKVRPAFHTVMQIADALGADLSELVGPRPPDPTRRGPCPVTTRGQCLLDLIRTDPDLDHYTPREVRLLRRFATWLKGTEPNRVRAIEILLEDLLRATEAGSGST